MKRISILFFLLASTNVFCQMIVDKGQLGKKGDTVYFSKSPFTGKAFVRTHSDKYNDPITGEEWYKNGFPDGVWKEWYLTGEKKFEGSFKNGLNDGIWIEWNVDGSIKRKLTFKNGLLIENKK